MQSLNICFTGKDQVEVRQEPVREPGPDEVLIAARKTLISTGTEGICLGRLFEPGTHWEDWVKYPFYPGYSLVGRVAAVGPEVTTVREGDRIAARLGHRQYIVTRAAHLFPVPDELSDEEVPWFSLASIVQNGVRNVQHALGETVVVIGVGALGQLVVQYARLLGAREIIAVDTAPMRLAMAAAHGATATIPLPVEEAREEVLRLTGGVGAEVVYDVTGNARVLEHALPLVKKLGRLMILGDSGMPSQQRLTRDVVPRSLRIIGAHDTNAPRPSSDHAFWSHAEMIRLFFTYVARGDMRVSDLITHRYAPADAPEAYRMLREERPSALGVLFDWDRV